MWISEPLSGEDYGYFRYTKYDSPFSGKVRDYLVLIPSPNANCIREGHEVAEAGDLKLKALASGVRDCLLATEKGPKMHRAGPLEWLLGINDRKELIAVAVPIEGRYFYSEKLSAVLVVSSNVALNEVLDWRIEAR
ncbi:MAG TPA: hypothetical protein VGR65_09150 [Casimicrobiaceae bacterium]|jgi:hypothetical protein|nr:hypothetical protein [Casimicrobiaceae bacterium]